MSETTAESQNVEQQPQGDPEDKPLGEAGEKALRAERERANELEKQLKSTNARLAKIERANESEVERAQRERDEFKAEAESVPQKVAAALRGHLASTHGISDEDRDLYLTATDPETLLRQAAGLVARADKAKKQGNHVPREGRTPQTADDPMREFTRNLFARATSE